MVRLPGTAGTGWGAFEAFRAEFRAAQVFPSHTDDPPEGSLG
ncbi:hypothetical protein [Asanoa sp. NPDC050611]